MVMSSDFFKWHKAFKNRSGQYGSLSPFGRNLRQLLSLNFAYFAFALSLYLSQIM
jgi:hypothetical protein